MHCSVVGALLKCFVTDTQEAVSFYFSRSPFVIVCFWGLSLSEGFHKHFQQECNWFLKAG